MRTTFAKNCFTIIKNYNTDIQQCGCEPAPRPGHLSSPRRPRPRAGCSAAAEQWHQGEGHQGDHEEAEGESDLHCELYIVVLQYCTMLSRTGYPAYSSPPPSFCSTSPTGSPSQTSSSPSANTLQTSTSLAHLSVGWLVHWSVGNPP